jgi:hypothetical protein
VGKGKKLFRISKRRGRSRGVWSKKYGVKSKK